VDLIPPASRDPSLATSLTPEINYHNVASVTLAFVHPVPG
jgi:hypothetical protein